jgi:hypothetical protein
MKRGRFGKIAPFSERSRRMATYRFSERIAPKDVGEWH